MLSLQKTTLAVLLSTLSLSSFAGKINDELDIGGAARINYSWLDYADDSSELKFDLFRIDVNYKEESGLFGSAQYRWMSYMEVVHHAYFGYEIDENQKFQVGITQVPFGMLPAAAHSFWYGAGYYLGFEDDYDTGVHYQAHYDGWRFDAAYFMNDEYADGTRTDRYSYDVITTKESPYKETGQVNLRLEKQFGDEVSHTVGASLQYAHLDYVPEDLALAEGEVAAAGSDVKNISAAIHWQMDWQQWQLQTQIVHYDYDVDNSDSIVVGAFADTLDVAAKADIVTLNLSRTFDVNWGPISQLNCYNDYSQVVASGDNQDDSILNVTGCMITAGKLYTYVDWIAGKNMKYAGGDGIGLDLGDDERQSRLNINIGYYF